MSILITVVVLTILHGSWAFWAISQFARVENEWHNATRRLDELERKLEQQEAGPPSFDFEDEECCECLGLDYDCPCICHEF